MHLNKIINLKIIFTLLATWMILSCEVTKNGERAEIHLDRSPDTIELFAPGFVSTDLYERDLAIAPDFNMFIYTLADYRQRIRCLVGITKVDGQWQAPEILSFSGKHHDIEPFFSADGQRLYFASNRPIYGDTTRSDYNIWYADKKDERWGEAVPLDTMINTRSDEFYPSLSRNGNLYFTATRTDGLGREDIFMAEWSDDHYLAPVPLPEAVNSNLFEFNAFIDPEERYIIFSSFGRSDGLGGGDLYISEKDAQDNWLPARNLGPAINSDKLDYCPFVDARELNFYFTSERSNALKERIDHPNSIDSLAAQITNGCGNIYRLNFTQLRKGHTE